jgi:hypothetical protein
MAGRPATAIQELAGQGPDDHHALHHVVTGAKEEAIGALNRPLRIVWRQPRGFSFFEEE